MTHSDEFRIRVLFFLVCLLFRFQRFVLETFANLIACENISVLSSACQSAAEENKCFDHLLKCWLIDFKNTLRDGQRAETKYIFS